MFKTDWPCSFLRTGCPCSRVLASDLNQSRSHTSSEQLVCIICSLTWHLQHVESSMLVYKVVWFLYSAKLACSWVLKSRTRALLARLSKTPGFRSQAWHSGLFSSLSSAYIRYMSHLLAIDFNLLLQITERVGHYRGESSVRPVPLLEYPSRKPHADDLGTVSATLDPWLSPRQVWQCCKWGWFQYTHIVPKSWEHTVIQNLSLYTRLMITHPGCKCWN